MKNYNVVVLVLVIVLVLVLVIVIESIFRLMNIQARSCKNSYKFRIPHSAFRIPHSAFCIFLALAACKLGPNYHRPALTVPAAYKSATSAEAAQPRLGRDWWRLFQDPELNVLMEEALLANQDLIAAMARVAEARDAAAAVQSQFYPVLTLNPAASRSRFPTGARLNTFGTNLATGNTPGGTGTTPTPVPTPTTGAGVNAQTATPSPNATPSASVKPTATPSATRTSFFQIPFDLSYEVDIWGRVRRAVEAARAQARFSQDDLEVVRQTLLADLAQDYFNLRSFEEQDRITARNVELYRQQFDLTQLQAKSGLVSDTNVYQARTLLESTQASELDLRRQRADLEHAIAILLGRPPAQFTLDSRPGVPTQPTIPAGLPSDLLRRRPDVAESEQNLIAAGAQIGVAKANLFPALTLKASAGLEAIQFSQLTDWSNHFWTIGADVAAPIFEGGRLRANLRQARARYQELEATYRGAVLAAFRDVEDALNDLHLRAEAAQAQTQAVDSARQYLQLTQVQYRTGLINYLQVIDADRSVLTNELTQAQIVYQRMISTVLLIKALGGGWDASPP